VNDAELHARASELFVALRARAPAGLEKGLAEAAREDPRLRAEIESLLAHDVRDATFDEGRPVGSPAADPGERIGPYRVVRRIGRGSSGHVFLAEQEEPIQRRVAIKVVPEAALDPALAARFEVERRALETAEHPNIARILDAGCTDGGLPYLVMEYVEGEPITAFCDRARLAIEGRLRLLLDVADAVQHAHQKGVVHRDLKPANVLVAKVGDRSIPVVLDFGIAKPVGGRLAEETPATSGLPIGTPSYMAPEQTGIGPVDTRADVYALGALAYELVSGRPPIDVSRGTGDPIEALQRIRTEVPRRVGQALRAGGSRSGALPRRSLIDDLDALLARALEKEPARRYATVASFAEDLRRALRREPIEARAPTLSYRAARFVQRNRLLVAAGALVAAALLVGVAGLALGIRRARLERAEAVLQSESQRAINRFLTDDLLSQATPDRGGKDTKVLDLLHRASRTIGERFPTQPLVAASVHQTLGDAYAELGEFDDAERHIDRALELRRANAGANAPDTVRSEISRASLLARRERFDEAETALRPVVVRARIVLGPDDRDLYAALNNLGVTLESLGRADDAVHVLEEALAGRKRILDPSDRDILETESNLALALDARGETERSLALLIAAYERAAAMQDPPRFSLLALANNVAATLQDLGRDREAAPYLRRASDLAAEVLGPENPETLTIEANLASLQAKLGDPAAAVATYRQILAARTATLGPAAPDTLLARHGYWEAVREDCRPDEAAVGFAELASDVDRFLGADHLLSAQTEASLARALYESGRGAEALEPAELAAAKLEIALGPDHFRTRGARALVDRIRKGAPAAE
jgi:non-specific serine/threonine protein kinase/serine/threonine-protein kinase